MEAAPGDLTPSHRYKLLTGLVVPRPIAWVSSRSLERVDNLAPFSFFSVVSHQPMMLSISVTGRKPDGTWKDTGCNLMPPERGGTGEFVVSVVTEDQAATMAKTARPAPATVSEFALHAIETAPSRLVAPPRVRHAPAAFECRTIELVEFASARLFVGEVVHIWVGDGMLDEGLRVDFDRLAAIGRLAGTGYVRTTDRLELADEGFFPADRKATV